MKNDQIAERYSHSIFELAEEKGQSKNVFEELLTVRQAMESRPALLNLLRSPLITRDEKSSLIEGILGQNAKSLSKYFLNLLVDKNRIESFPDIIDQLQQVIRRKEGIQEVTIVTARPLHSSILQLLEKNLEKMTHLDILVESEIDPSLIGGIQIRIGNRLIDGSVRSKLNTLEAQLRNVKVV